MATDLRAPEVLYAVRRQDGAAFGGYDYTFLVVPDPSDWSPAIEAEDDYGTVYEMVRMTVEVIDTKELPTCNQCDEPARLWGLCEPHAREDDPKHFETKVEG